LNALNKSVNIFVSLSLAEVYKTAKTIFKHKHNKSKTTTTTKDLQSVRNKVDEQHAERVVGAKVVARLQPAGNELQNTRTNDGVDCHVGRRRIVWMRIETTAEEVEHLERRREAREHQQELVFERIVSFTRMR
jgi:hypothetical protein